MHDGSEGELYDLRDDPLQRSTDLTTPTRCSCDVGRTVGAATSADPVSVRRPDS
jgi:hypothetical protein